MMKRKWLLALWMILLMLCCAVTASATNSYTGAYWFAVEWNDGNNYDNLRPDSVDLMLLARGEETKYVFKLKKDDDWTPMGFSGGVIGGLPKFDEGGWEIEYTVKADTIEGYHQDITVDTTQNNIEKVFTISYTRIVNVTNTIKWDDADNQDGKRPDSVTLYLYKNGTKTNTTVTLDASNNWSGTFADLPAYDDNGERIEYNAVPEAEVTGYSCTAGGNEIDGFTFDYAHTPETIDVKSKLYWYDSNNQDGKQPDSVTLHLYKNGVDTGNDVTLNKNNNWGYTYSNLPRYEKGSEITYSIQRETIEEYVCYSANTQKYGVVFMCYHTPETISIASTVKWNDNENQDGIRPDSVTFKLVINSQESAKSITLSADNNWSASFTNLPKYQNGRLISYDVKGQSVEGYSISGGNNGSNVYAFTYSHAPETVDIITTVLWDDVDDQDGIRPDSVTLHLYANGVDTGRQITLNANENWRYVYSDCPLYESGKEIVYSVQEEDVQGYTIEVDDEINNHFLILYTHMPAKTAVTVETVWDDNENQDGIRPESVVVRLLANGMEVSAVQMSAGGNWKVGFSDLDQYEFGKEIAYTMEAEALPAGYSIEMTGDAKTGFTLTFSHTPENAAITGTVAWNDNNNQDGIRPQSVLVRLLANGEDVGKSATLNAAGNWTVRFGDLPKFANGKAIAYMFEADEIEGYTCAVTESTKGGFTITNSHTPETTTFRVRKVFKGLNAGENAPAIALTLYCNGEEYSAKMPTPDADGWYVYTGLPMRANGQLVVYTAKEMQTAGFVTSHVNVGEHAMESDCLYDGGTSESYRIPQTGDESALALWCALAVIACAGVAVLLRKRKG